jgi:hypothetical protein
MAYFTYSAAGPESLRNRNPSSGRPPYETGPTQAILYRVIHGSPDVGGVPGQLRPVVEAALARDPGARPSAADILRYLTGNDAAAFGTAEAPTQTVLASTWTPGAVLSTGHAGNATRKSRRRPVVLLAGAAVLAAVVGTSAAVLTASPGQVGGEPAQLRKV